MQAHPQRIGAYRVDGLLGRGASGVVYRAWDEALERPVALKVLTDLDPEGRGRFTIEAKAAARIVHPNVVQVHAVGEHDGDAFIAQELVDGHPLSTILAADRTLGAAAAIDVAIQVAEGLAAAEAVGVLHRDIKPHNLLVTKDGLVKIADFGLAKILDAPSSYTADGTTLGTPHYMSPEQGQGKVVDPRSDQYALGASLYHLLAGAPPFDADTAVATIFLHANEPLPPLGPEVPAALAAAVEQMLAKDPADRFASFEALVDALEKIEGEADSDLFGLVADAAEEEPSSAKPRPNVARLERFALAATAIVAVGVIAAATKPAARLERSNAAPIAAPEVEIPVRPLAEGDDRDPFTPTTVAAGQPSRPVVRRPSSVPDYLRDLKRGGRRGVAAARALAKRNDQRATLPLIDALQGGDPNVAVAAAEALGQLQDIRAIEPLARASKNAKSEDVRAAAAAAHRRLWHVEE
ncbi:MAG: protein kinase [Deltaproteobacteria bacterium]